MFVHRGSVVVNLEKVTSMQVHFVKGRKRPEMGTLEFLFENYYNCPDDGITQSSQTMFFKDIHKASYAMQFILQCVEHGKKVCWLDDDDLGE